MHKIKYCIHCYIFYFQICHILGPPTKFLKANFVLYCFLYCAIMTIGSNYWQIIEVMLRVPSNIWRVLAATGIVLLNIKLYLCFYWTPEELRSLRLRGPTDIAESVFYNYLLIVERTVRFLRNVKDSVKPTQHYNWQAVEVTFLKRADPRGSSSTDDHKYFVRLGTRLRNKGIRFLSRMRSAEDELLERLSSAKNSEKFDRMKALLGKVNFLDRCLEKSSRLMFLAGSGFFKKLSENFSYEVIFMTNSLEQIRQMYFVDKVIWLWDTCYPEQIVRLAETHLLSKIRIWEDIVPNLKIFLYDVLPLTILIAVIWNFAILVLYLFDDRIINVMQPFPDWKILLILLLIPVVLSTLLHRYWTKEDLYEMRFFYRRGFLKCLIVYYMPLDDIVYRIFIAVNGILFPSDWFEID